MMKWTLCFAKKKLTPKCRLLHPGRSTGDCCWTEFKNPPRKSCISSPPSFLTVLWVNCVWYLTVISPIYFGRYMTMDWLLVGQVVRSFSTYTSTHPLHCNPFSTPSIITRLERVSSSPGRRVEDDRSFVWRRLRSKSRRLFAVSLIITATDETATPDPVCFASSPLVCYNARFVYLATITALFLLTSFTYLHYVGKILYGRWCQRAKQCMVAIS